MYTWTFAGRTNDPSGRDKLMFRNILDPYFQENPAAGQPDILPHIPFGMLALATEDR